MKKAILFNIVIVIFLFANCSKDPAAPADQIFIGVWECDSTVLGPVHSMMFKSKKYEYRESGEYERTWTFPVGFKDWGKWNYNTESNIIMLEIDSVFEQVFTLNEEIEIYSVNEENLVLIEDYDSLVLQNGETEFYQRVLFQKEITRFDQHSFLRHAAPGKTAPVGKNPMGISSPESISDFLLNGCKK
jgi:hypothetical protein